MEETLATCATAFVTADPGRMEWTIGNDRIRKTVTWRAHGGLRLTALENRTTGRVWQPALDASSFAGGEFLVQWEAVTYSARQATELLGIDARTEADAVLLYITLRVAGALDVTVCCRLHSGADVFEQWLEISARQPGVLSSVAPLTISAASVPTPTLHWVRGIQNHGAGMPDSGPYPAFQVRHEALGAVMLESGLRSTWHEIAWLALDSADDGDGLFTGLLYSGRWSAAAQAVDSGGVTLDLSTAGYALPLAAGEQWTSPAAFVGLYHGDLDDAAHVQHAFMRAAVVPPTPDDFPWVQYNTWFAHLVDYDEALLRREAELAEELDEQPGRVAARARALGQRLLAGLDARLHADQVADHLLQPLVQPDDEVDGRDRLARDRGDQLGHERAGRLGLEERQQLLEQARRVGEGPGVGGSLDEEVERVEDRHLGHEVDLDREMVRRLVEQQPRQPVAVRILLPVDEMLGRADLQAVGQDPGAAVGGGAQPDDMRPEIDAAIIAVSGLMVERDLDRHGIPAG